MVRAHVLVEGRVQGVAYRAFAQERAGQTGLTGWVKNLPDGRVEVEVQGPRSSVEAYLSELRKGPPLARVDRLQVDWIAAVEKSQGFHIRRENRL